MSVSNLHDEYKANVEKWCLVRSIVDMQNMKQYLPEIDPNDKTRTKEYKDRAVFTNFTNKTKDGLIGAIFRSDPQIDLPAEIKYLENNADGAGQSLAKMSKEICGEVLQSGRYGLLADYPATNNTTLTKADVAKQGLAAYLYKYKAEAIINWHETSVNGQRVLDLVTLKEPIQVAQDDGFTWAQATQYRALRLIGGVYTVVVYNEKEEIVSVTQPLNGQGQTFDDIPFIFIGSENNDCCVDNAPLFDIASINVAHYRNSADQEEFIHYLGQPTLFFSTDISEEEYKAYNPNGIVWGSRKGHNLGTNSKAEIVQAQPTNALDEAMKRKEEQVVMLGARLITKAGLDGTINAARMKYSGENSILSNIVDNVEDGIVCALEYAREFMSSVNVDVDSEVESDILFELNNQFFDIEVNPRLYDSYVQLYMQGIIGRGTIWNKMRRDGTIESDMTDDDIKADIASEPPLQQTPFPSLTNPSSDTTGVK